MRIEKINEHQIRCTLYQKDLKDREIRISELAYGTEKARALFRDMMQQASYEFGFEADDIPLMIEAIPMLPDALILLITKVEDPDELDTRFSYFTDDPSEHYFDDSSTDDFVIINSWLQLPTSTFMRRQGEQYGQMYQGRELVRIHGIKLFSFSEPCAGETCAGTLRGRCTDDNGPRYSVCNYGHDLRPVYAGVYGRYRAGARH